MLDYERRWSSATWRLELPAQASAGALEPLADGGRRHAEKCGQFALTVATEVAQYHTLTLGGGEPSDQGQQLTTRLALLDELEWIVLRAGDHPSLLKGKRWATLPTGHAVAVLEHNLAQPGWEGAWRPQRRQVEGYLQKHVLGKLNIAEPGVSVGDHQRLKR